MLPGRAIARETIGKGLRRDDGNIMMRYQLYAVYLRLDFSITTLNISFFLLISGVVWISATC